MIEDFVIVAVYIMLFAVVAIAYWLIVWVRFLISNALDDRKKRKGTTA